MDSARLLLSVNRQARFRRPSLAFVLALFVACSNRSGAQQLPSTPSEDSESTVSIRADSQEKTRASYRLQGHVEVVFRQVKVTADEATYDATTGEVVARGNVTFSDPGSHLEAEEARYNLKTGQGYFLKGRGYVHAKVRPRPRVLATENPFYIQAEKVERLDQANYKIEHGRVTTCECEDKGWSLSARRGHVEVGEKVVTQGSVFRLFRVPLFYAPVTITSLVRNQRRTGFLLPHFGNSSQKGFVIGSGFFWAINPSADLLLGVENYSIRGLARSARFRARPSESSEISVAYFGVNDKGTGNLRQFRAPGESLRVTGQAENLFAGFRGVVDVDYINSLAFRLTFTDNFTDAVASEARQTGFLSKNFDAYSLNFYVTRYQNFLSTARVPGNSVIIRETPSVAFSGADQQLGRSSFYLAFDASATAVGRTEPGVEIPRLAERVDFSPQLTLRTKPFWGFHITPSAGLRATHYGTSLKSGLDPLNRLLGEFQVDLRPPSFERVFFRPGWRHRFKHVFEPQIRYRRVAARRAGDIADVVRYDQIDIFTETNEIEYSVTNALFVRKDSPEAQEGTFQARELLSLRLTQKYYFDPTFGGAFDPGKLVVFDPTISLTGFAFARGRRLSPLVSVLKFSPASNYDTELRADIDPNGRGFLNAGITSHLKHGLFGLSLTDFFVSRTAAFSTPIAPVEPLSTLRSFNLLRTVATYGDVNRKGLSGAFGVDYNFTLGIAHQVVSQVSYNFGCFGLDFEFRRFALGGLRREHQFRVALSLANVGTFGNLKPRERMY